MRGFEKAKELVMRCWQSGALSLMLGSGLFVFAGAMAVLDPQPFAMTYSGESGTPAGMAVYGTQDTYGFGIFFFLIAAVLAYWARCCLDKPGK